MRIKLFYGILTVMVVGSALPQAAGLETYSH